MSDRGANTGDLGPPELSKLEFANEPLALLRFVCVLGSMGAESTKQMPSLVSRRVALLGGGGRGKEPGSLAAHGLDPNPGSVY